MSKLEYSGRTSSYMHKNDKDWKDKDHEAQPALKQVWWFDAQWSDCPVEVEADVKKLWRLYELGNDHFFIKSSVNDLREMIDPENENVVEIWDGENSKWVEEPLKLDYLLDYLKFLEVPEDREIYFHWWW